MRVLREMDMRTTMELTLYIYPSSPPLTPTLAEISAMPSRIEADDILNQRDIVEIAIIDHIGYSRCQDTFPFWDIYIEVHPCSKQ